ncbi:hypothetical protein ACHAWF_003994 [Thalassiosira exigua]
MASSSYPAADATSKHDLLCPSPILDAVRSHASSGSLYDGGGGGGGGGERREAVAVPLDALDALSSSLVESATSQSGAGLEVTASFYTYPDAPRSPPLSGRPRIWRLVKRGLFDAVAGGDDDDGVDDKNGGGSILRKCAFAARLPRHIDPNDAKKLRNSRSFRDFARFLAKNELVAAAACDSKGRIGFVVPLLDAAGSVDGDGGERDEEYAADFYYAPLKQFLPWAKKNHEAHERRQQQQRQRQHKLEGEPQSWTPPYTPPPEEECAPRGWDDDEPVAEGEPESWTPRYDPPPEEECGPRGWDNNDTKAAAPDDAPMFRPPDDDEPLFRPPDDDSEPIFKPPDDEGDSSGLFVPPGSEGNEDSGAGLFVPPGSDDNGASGTGLFVPPGSEGDGGSSGLFVLPGSDDNNNGGGAGGGWGDMGWGGADNGFGPAKDDNGGWDNNDDNGNDNNNDDDNNNDNGNDGQTNMMSDGVAHVDTGAAAADAFYSGLTRNLDSRADSRLYHMRAFNGWVKAMQIAELDPDTSAASNKEKNKGKGKRRSRNSPLRVLDLACGKGGDLGKWTLHRRKLENYVGVDVARGSLVDAAIRARQMSNRNKSALKRCTFALADLGEDVPGRKRTKRARRMQKLSCWTLQDESPEDRRRDPTFVPLEGGGISESDRFDVISIQFAIHYMMSSRKRARRFFHTVSELLEVGGNLVATTIDARVAAEELMGLGLDYHFDDFDRHADVDAEVAGGDVEKEDDNDRRKASSASGATVSVGGGVCRLKFDADTLRRVFRPSGTKEDMYGLQYTFTLVEGSDHAAGVGEAVDLPEWLTPLPALEELAEEGGLKLEYATNFHQFFEERKDPSRHHAAHNALYNMKVLSRDGSVSAQEWDVSRMYVAIKFRKVGESRIELGVEYEVGEDEMRE